MNFYNEINVHAAEWLRELIKAGCIAPGLVEERSITELDYHELAKYGQCHFFAGIGGWSHALRLAGWRDDEPVWTASCPCQPFSVAGKREVDKDERHLWPAFRDAVEIGRPAIIFGEQVASKDGRIWLSGVRTDLEALGYVVGAADLCAAGVSAPHIRQRLYWVAYRAAGISDADNSGCEKLDVPSEPKGTGPHSWNGTFAGMVTAEGYHEHWWSGALQMGWNCLEGEIERSGRKYRAQWRVKPGLPLLADGVPGRVAQLCGFGNAIVPILAAEFIRAAREAIQMK